VEIQEFEQLGCVGAIAQHGKGNPANSDAGLQMSMLEACLQ
jgi:hypothetical protein